MRENVCCRHVHGVFAQRLIQLAKGLRPLPFLDIIEGQAFARALTVNLNGKEYSNAKYDDSGDQLFERFLSRVKLQTSHLRFVLTMVTTVG